MPLLPYQKILYDSLQDHKHIWVKKSRGRGVTEILLCWIAYCCTTQKFPINSRVIIITGPRIDLAEDLVVRFKRLFPFNVLPRTENTVAVVNGVKLEAFPTHHVDIARGLTDVRFILIDEADYFPNSNSKRLEL